MTVRVETSPISLIRARAAEAPGASALVSPRRAPTTFEHLVANALDVAGRLRAFGVGERDRVALLVENGPEAAAGFLAISCAASCAPLNPAYRAPELEFFLRDLDARALVIGAELDSPGREVASSLGVDVLELVTDEAWPSGAIALDGLSETCELEPPDPSAEALVLHTSGTTARPKLVPLAHRHLARSASNVAETLMLTSGDRCLNLMPLFHIHGLVAALLASLVTGGSVACTPGFHRHRALGWLSELAPTWMTAVPTMYQAVVELGESEPALLREHDLRFVRSSSAALPVPVLERLERLLRVPVVEAYGMTEAAHQVASNPLPPGKRKPGSVGRAAGPEIAVVGDDWRRLPPGVVGEVAIRGEQVFEGYEGNAEVNARAFRDGWFRTGDQGRLDEDGYLFLTGRLKEIVNRGGEKISPLEVDDVLLRHPAVAQAVSFGIPDERLGEEVAAAVVLREPLGRPEHELQDFVAQALAPFKVPRRVVVVDEIPKGPTGKVQRVTLGETLDVSRVGDPLERVWHPELEGRLVEIWSDVLGMPEVGPLDDFFALGGDSILGAEAIARVRNLLTIDVPLVSIVRAPSPRSMAVELERMLHWDQSGIMLVQPGDPGRRPVFYVHGADGHTVGIAAVARRLGPARGVYALQPPWPVEDPPRCNVEDLAETYVDEIRGVQSDGPWLIVGFCMGAAVALEIAHRLGASGSTVGLVLLDPHLRRPTGLHYALWLARRRARQGRLGRAVVGRLRRAVRGRPISHPAAGGTGRPAILDVLESARDAYIPRTTPAPTALLRTEGSEAFEMPDWYLRAIFPRVVTDERIASRHEQVFRPPAVDDLAPKVARSLEALERELAHSQR